MPYSLMWTDKAFIGAMNDNNKPSTIKASIS